MYITFSPYFLYMYNYSTSLFDSSETKNETESKFMQVTIESLPEGFYDIKYFQIFSKSN